MKDKLNYSTGIIFTLIAMLSMFLPSISDSAEYLRINSVELQAMIDDGKAITIVDVREPELFQVGHIPGAINIPYEVSHDRILKELNPTERIVFVCHGGPMGDELSEILIENGYKDVFNLKGGMRRGWEGERVR